MSLERPLFHRLSLLVAIDDETPRFTRKRKHGGGAAQAAEEPVVPQTLFYSTCTGTVGDDLSTNVPEIGAAFVHGATNWTIRVAGDQMARCDLADTVARFEGASAVLLSADVLRNSGATSVAGLVARRLDGSNQLIATISATAISIYEEVAGVVLLRATTVHAYTVAVEYAMTLTITAADEAAAAADGETVTYAGILNAGAATCGLYGDGLTVSSRFDEVTATEEL